MRGIVAKRLRRQAQEETVGMPSAVYQMARFTSLRVMCTRYRYQALKQEYRRARQQPT